MKETVLYGGRPFEVDVKPITLICHHGMESVKAPDRVLIGPVQTLGYIENLSPEHWKQIRVLPVFVDAFKTVFPDQDVPENIAQEGLGMRHVSGMIIMLIETILAQKKAFLQQPESYLHPKYQCNLADLLIKFTGGEA